MTEQARETITIAAPVAQVLATLVDFERYPEWAEDLKAARVVERDDEACGIEVEFRCRDGP
ncbi:MAG: SRPBCC family protein [Acidimicrobiales bacterium]